MEKSTITERILSRTHTFSWLNLLSISVPLLFFSLMFFMFPFREQFEFDPDEGLSAMTAFLLTKGYSLYSEIWNDHPPLFPYQLAVWFRAFGFDINNSRTYVLLLSTALLGAVFQILRSTWGPWHAISGVLLIFLLPYYTTLSISVMRGLPAIAFAMLSLMSLVTWHQRHNSLWLVFSAVALGLSILTKLFTGFLAPIFFFGILIGEIIRLGKAINWRDLLRPLLIWSLVFTGVSLGLGLFLVKPTNIGQLFNVHLEARHIELFINIPETYTLTGYLRQSWPILLLAIVGGVFALLDRNWLSLYLAAWATAGYLLLLFQVPVWFHHQLLVTIPAAMLAGIAVGEAVRPLPQLFRTRNFLSPRSLLIVGVIVGFVLALINLIPQVYLDFTTPVYFLERERMFMVRMTNHAPKTQWVVTDVPMYAFRIGRPVPPAMAAFSEKRLITGSLTETQIIDIVNDYKPEQVLIGRFNLPELEASIKDDYHTLYSRGKRTLYLRNDLKGH